MTTHTKAIILEDGKYTVRHENGTNFHALRYGEPWQDLTGDGFILALVQRIEELEAQLLNPITKLYYEAHITIEPIFEGELEVAKQISSLYGFRMAELLMKKRADDVETRSKYDTFMTGQGIDLENLKKRVQNLVSCLQFEGYKVWRYKIEDIILDSRTEDVLNLLGNE